MIKVSRLPGIEFYHRNNLQQITIISSIIFKLQSVTQAAPVDAEQWAEENDAELNYKRRM
jgi:hypothetical protein